MPRKLTGSLYKMKTKDGKRYFAGRIHLRDGEREYVNPPDGMSEARAREWVAAAQERETLTGEFSARKYGSRFVHDQETFGQYLVRWVLSRRDAGLKSVETEEGYLRKHVIPIIGKKPIATITKDDVEDVRDALDSMVRAGIFKWKTARNIWGYVASLFADACESKDRTLRVREDNPTANVRSTDRGDDISKTFLYPNEFLQLVSCRDVPLRWRRMFALAVYTYARAAELNALEFGNGVDVDRGIIEITQQVDRRTAQRRGTKTGLTRRLPVELNLLPLLRLIHEEQGGVGRITHVSVTDRKLWLQLRRCLVIAGVKRRALHERTEQSAPITFHDLRATGITWCAVRGDDPLRIKQRAGHKTFSTTERYVREAENLADGFGEVFPPLPAELLERPNDMPKYLTERVVYREKQSGGAGNRRQVFASFTAESATHPANKKRVGARLAKANLANPGLKSLRSGEAKKATKRSKKRTARVASSHRGGAT